MKGPFCNFCLQTGILCGKCQSLIDSGELTNVDISVAMALNKLEQRHNELKDITFFRAVEVGSLIIVLVGENDLSAILGHRGKVIKELEQNLKKKIRVLETSSSTGKLVEDLLAPAEIAGINTIWLPDGTKVKKVRVRGQRGKLPASVDTLEDVVQKLTNEPIRIVFE
ncbi:KH domain-containing protein [Candidatus Borrarchaeum sp.]|uniref:KH domain-containing protein n=1 Tax=Candidatus Borrarchaeum sp. TaxID=2846742 RepID=UPI00257F73E4|nr:KH domain-containing protein [Candidatus Borrarchaeum sp.]